MACFSIAVVRAEIKTEHAAELLKSPAGLKALAALLERLVGTTVTVTQSSPTYASLWCNKLTVTLRDGTVSVSSTLLGRAEVDALTARINAAVKEGGIQLAQERTVRGIAARYGQDAVLADRRVGTNRVVKVRIPL